VTCWLVRHPLSLYREDVKALAREHGLKIVDAAMANERAKADAEPNPPALTLVGEGNGKVQVLLRAKPQGRRRKSTRMENT
jgi:hypothetical protein